jgi:hypothetical protein
MMKSARNHVHRSRLYLAKGVESSRLRRRKYGLVRSFGIPEDALGGSLNRVQRKCGKPTCRCASGEGHLMWTLTYSVGGKRRVEFIPADLVPVVQPLVEKGRAYRDAVAEVLAINAQLFSRWRRQKQRKRS